MQSPSQRRISVVLRTKVDACRFEEAVRAVEDAVRRRKGIYFSPANVYSVTLADGDPAYRKALDEAAFVTADGMPVVWVLKRTEPHAERVHNDDLFLACCERLRSWRHFLVGGREGQPELVAASLKARFPGIDIVGSAATPQRPVPAQRTARIIEDIKSARADVVWVGMGTPAQDFWMSEAAPRAGVPMVAVGSAFDLLTGRSRPAPEWMKRHGLQWLFRFAQEPRRLAKRYLWYNALFAVALLAQATRSRRRGAD
jgi:N-acetylglucosaminyldiphosphoundecaprenol N-acetyl-beta-D-mannosaminyltransferase